MGRGTKRELTTLRGGQLSLRVLAAAVVCAGLVAALLGHGTVAAVGPYPPLGTCPVFPDPPAGLPANAPSLPSQAAWNQDVSKAPLARNSDATIAFIDAQGGDHLHPDFGSPREYGFPYSVVRAGQRRLPVHYTAYGSESDRGPFPIPKRAPVEGGNGSDGDRHVLVVDRDACRDYEVYAASKFGCDLKPRHKNTHHHWIVKGPNRGRGDRWDPWQVQEDRDYQTGQVHEGIAEAFELAGIEWGRADYAIIDGKPVIYEINSNPVTVPQPDKYLLERQDSQDHMVRITLDALEQLDSHSPPHPGIQLEFWLRDRQPA